jgi:hypothetical protein
MLTKIEEQFLRHILGIPTLSRDEFAVVNRAMYAMFDVDSRWRAFTDAANLMFKRQTIPDDLRNCCPLWIQFLEIHFDELQDLKYSHDPNGYQSSDLIKINEEAPCQFCSRLTDRKKRIFRSEEDAVNFARHVSEKYGSENQVPYKCPDGHGWHLTSKGHILVINPKRGPTARNT